MPGDDRTPATSKPNADRKGLKKVFMSKMFDHTPVIAKPETSIMSLNEIVQSDRWTLERRSRFLAQSHYLGNELALCRVMGRYKIYVRTDDIGFASHIMMEGLWEPWITSFMAQTVQPGMWVADVGANHGYYTLLMADIVSSSGRVAAVEPHPFTASLLSRTMNVNGYLETVEVSNLACGATNDAELYLLTPPNEPKNAHITPYVDAAGGDYSIVRGTTLTTLLAAWPQLDFIKIDVEGAEEGVLQGARPLIEKFRPTILLEFRPSRCVNPGETLQWLQDVYGVIHDLDPYGRVEPISLADIVADPDNERMLVLRR